MDNQRLAAAKTVAEALVIGSLVLTELIKIFSNLKKQKTKNKKTKKSIQQNTLPWFVYKNKMLLTIFFFNLQPKNESIGA